MVGNPRGAWVARERSRLVRQFRARARPSAGETLRSYLGSPVPVLGLSVPEFRVLVRSTARNVADRPVSDVLRLVRDLWAGSVYEEKLAAIELLGQRPLVGDARSWHLASRWVDQATGWALSDSLASGPVAAMVAASPKRFGELQRWTRSRNPWRRRASTYALRAWVRSGDLDRPFRVLERLADDRERWVQRAVGTWLRECWKKDRGRTERFLRREAHRLAPVTITVATERAPRKLREELRRAAANSRPPRRGL